MDLGGDLLAELEPPVFLVLRVVLDQEPAAGWVLLPGQLDDSAADGKDAGLDVQVVDPQLSQLTPAQAAFDVRLDQQLGVRIRQRLVEAVELGGGDDAPWPLRIVGSSRRGWDGW